MVLFKRPFGALCAMWLSLPLMHAAAANEYGLPEKIQDTNILHCFNWTFTQIQQELPAIAEAGFGAIQVSPVQGNCAANAEWFYAYMPYDIAMKANGNGNRSGLKRLCSKAAEYGIKVIVDVVANHVNKMANYHHEWWDGEGRVRFSGNVNYSNRFSITHGQLGDYGDVNSEDPEVQQRALAFVQDLKDVGVAGIRWDAAKHIALPSEHCDFWPTVCADADMWNYGEILDGPGGNKKYELLKEYTQYMSVTDTDYSSQARNSVRSGRVPSASAIWAKNEIDPTKLVYWAESHDTYANEGGTSKNVKQDVIDRAYALVASRNGATALYLSRPEATGYTEIKMGIKGSTHFTAKEVAEVNKFRNTMGNRADSYSTSSGVASITRQGGGAVIVVGNGQSTDVNIANGGSYCPAGTYTDRVSGNTFTVTSTTISGKVGSTGIAVIYNAGAGIDDILSSPSPQEHSPVYYTLTGVQVNDPAPGLYIVRRGDKVTKEYIR